MEQNKVNNVDVINDVENNDIDESKEESTLQGIGKLQSQYEKNDDHEKLYTEVDFEILPIGNNRIIIFINKTKDNLTKMCIENSLIIQWTIGLTLLVLYVGYLIWFVLCNSQNGTLSILEDNIRLIWMSCILFVWILYRFIRVLLEWKKPNISILRPVWWEKFLYIIYYSSINLICLFLMIYILMGLAIHIPYNLVSFVGMISMILFSFIFSTAPHMINWNTVLTGILLQFIFAFIIITTKPGYTVFKFLGDRVSTVLGFTNAGIDMVFGTGPGSKNFAFRVLPIIIYLSSLFSILYFLGFLQIFILGFGTIMHLFMGTTYGESFNAVANIFIGMTEAPLLIKPFLGQMTNSELFAVMTAGFASIAGTVLGAFISYGVPANHLISACVMSAPAALAISKIMYPETKKSKNTKDTSLKLIKSPHKNIVEAATAGATEGISLVASIAANIIAFVSLLAFVNAILAWMGERACMEKKLTFEFLCSYLFWPLSLVMGVNVKDCRKVAELIGIKIFLNEFIAFDRLGTLISNRKIYDTINITIATVSQEDDDMLISFQNGTDLVLKGGIIEAHRSVVIATYALCGFSNLASVGILLSSLSSMIPHRRTDLSQMILRSMVGGNIACFLTACIAGLFYGGQKAF